MFGLRASLHHHRDGSGLEISSRCWGRVFHTRPYSQLISPNPSPVWSAAKAGGKLHFHAERQFKAFLSALRDGAYEVIVRRQVRHRTSPQVAYYFGVVIPAFAHYEGYRTDEHYHLHDGLMHKFWPLEPDKVTKAPRRRRLTLKEQGSEPPLTDEEMGIHIEQVVMFAAERGCVIPEAEKAQAA